MKKITEIYEKYKEIILYLLFGVITTVVSLGVCYLTLKIGVRYIHDENGDPTELLDVEQTKAKYKVDGVVREIVQEEIKSEFASLLVGYLKAIAVDNGLPPSKSKLTAEERAIKKALTGFVASFLAPFNRSFGRPEGIRDEWTDDQFYSVVKSDAYEFAREWARQLCMKNEPGTDNPEAVLSRIITKPDND